MCQKYRIAAHIVSALGSKTELKKLFELLFPSCVASGIMLPIVNKDSSMSSQLNLISPPGHT